MKARKKFRYGLLFCLILTVALGIFAFWGYWHFYNSLPENIHINGEDGKTVEFEWPLTGEIVSNNVHSQKSDYTLDVKYLGLFHVKNINVNIMDKDQLIPCGFPLGIYLEMDGLLVVDITSFKNNMGNTVCPCENLLEKGDYILKINGDKINSKEEFTAALEKCSGDVVLGIRRGDNYFDVRVKLEKDALNKNHLGVWVKDDAQGIGTLTYIDANKNFGALGHGMNDTDCGKLIDTKTGKIYNAHILSVTKGAKGEPGEFVGTIDYNSGNIIGIIEYNTNLGIYGRVNDKFLNKIQGNEYCEPLEVAFKEDIELGKAQIQTYSNGGVSRFDIVIEKVELSDSGNKGIKFQVVDENLLNQTNGIVQGMSGSPIIQNGKIIGAVTHVFVNDPAKGYGIFIENMLGH